MLSLKEEQLNTLTAYALQYVKRMQSLGNDTPANRAAYIDGIEDTLLSLFTGTYPAHQAREAIEELFETI